MKTPRARRTRSRRRGAALIEFALSIGFILPLFFGAFQFGLAFQNYAELISGVRAGARYGSYRTYDSATSTPSAAYLAAVRNVVVYGNPAGGTTPITPGLTTSHVDVQIGMLQGSPDTVRVAINNYQLNVLFTSWTLRKPVATFPYSGRWAPAPEL